MEENTNKSLAINSIILYGRLILTSIFSVLTTRYSLEALGVDDFGLFSVLGSVISFIAIINTIMLSTSNRFIAVAIGRGNEEEIREQFNINFIIHLIIAFVTILFAYPIGDWYINHHLNYNGDLSLAKWVFYLTVIGSAISFVSVPYNGLLMAKEKFIVFCSVETVCSFFKLILSVGLLYLSENRLVVYAIGISLLSALPTLFYAIYCSSRYKDYVKFKLVKNKAKYREVLAFSVWVGYGAVACVGKSQGAALLVNMFFSTVMNTALGIANSVNSMITMVANAITQPVAPQLTKCYAAGDYQRADNLLVLSIKLGYFAMFIIAVPLLLETEWILKIWLGDVPPYAVSFSQLMIIDALVISLNSGISTIIFASGKIKLYQISINTLRILAIVAGYFVLKAGYKSESLLITYIMFSVLIFFVIQYVLKKTLNYNTKYLWKRAYVPSILLTILFIPFIFVMREFHPVFRIILVMFFVVILIYRVGLSKAERLIINNKVRFLCCNSFICKQ